MNYVARPLEPDEQKAFRADRLSFVGEFNAAKRETSTAWKWLGIGGFAMGVLGMGAFMLVLPRVLQHTVETHYIAVVEGEGFVTEMVGPDDAPKLFGPRTRENQIKNYVRLWVEYQPGTDRKHFDDVQALSSPEQAARYVEWHDNDPDAPRQLDPNGSVETDEFVFFPRGASIVKGVETFEYDLRFKRKRTIKGAAGPWEDRRAVIQFHFDPKLIQTGQQVQDNPAGFVATYFAERK